jgi:hypothetical protein
MRSAAGQQWSIQKARDTELKNAYEAVGRSYSAQRAFRQKWATDRYEDEKERREKRTKHQFDYGKYGRYKPFSVIVRDEGGDLAAHRAALAIVQNELVLRRAGKLLGGFAPWFMVNALSNRTEWMHLETRFSDMFSQAWESTSSQCKATTELNQGAPPVETPQKAARKRQFAEVGSGGVAAKSAEADEAEPETGKDTGKGSTGKKGGTGKKPKAVKKEPEDESEKLAKAAERKEQQKQMNELKSLKTKLLTTSAAGKAVLDTIRTNSAWEYFNNENSTKPLTTALRPRLNMCTSFAYVHPNLSQTHVLHIKRHLHHWPRISLM